MLGRIGPYPGNVPGTHIFYTPLPKRLGEPKSEIQSSNYSNISKPFPLTDCLKARWMQLRTLLLKTWLGAAAQHGLLQFKLRAKTRRRRGHAPVRAF